MPRFYFKSQSGYIGLTLIFFLIVLSAILYPWAPPKSEGAACIVGEPPGGYFELTGLPAIKDIFIPAESDMSGSEPIYGGPEPTEKATYVLIRKNVPTSKTAEPTGWNFLGGNSATDQTHTINLGELAQKPGYDAYIPSRWGEMDLPTKGRKYIRNMGLLLFANNNPATIKNVNGNTIYLVDVYQDKRIFDVKDKGYSETDIFICGVDTAVGPSFVTSPAQDRSPKKDQLQLEWFLFTSDKVWGVHCKPAIYLYPPEKKLVNVKVSPSGFLMYTDPPYDPDKGWTVWAEPDGKLSAISPQPSATDKIFDYLYFESKIRDEVIQKPTRGWVVKYEELENLYQNILPKLGLNEQQKNDFIEYWNKALSKDPAKYYFVGIIDQDNVNQIEKLEITPKPDSINRVRIYFERLDSPKTMDAPDLPSHFSLPTSHFHVTEWGGMVKNDQDHPFTCSQ